MNRFSIQLLCLFLVAVGSLVPGQMQSIEERTAEMTKQAGLFDIWFDESKGRVWMRVAEESGEFLYVESLESGLGNNDIGIDRSQLGENRVVEFRRMGEKLLLIERNLGFRAVGKSGAELRAVEQSFAPSVIWGFKVAARSGQDVLIDLTPFLLRDAHGVVQTLKRNKQGSWKLDQDRSAVAPDGVKVFPQNVELGVWLTYESSNAGGKVRSVAADGQAITLNQRHSLIKLPDSDYRPRAFDPRAPCLSIAFADYGTPLDQPLIKRWILRHRLEKKNPDQALSEAVRPLVYYVDRGAPEPVRSALLEGARWWNEAFEAAGFKNAFRVEVLPDGADPMDVRFNVIQWVHRSTRGWSYGSSVIDPRTGEILKGHVLLGSLRARQDRMIFEALDPQFAGRGCPCGMGGGPGWSALGDLDPKNTAVELSLARLRQLAAHEVGHTLGFAHNFAASTKDRCSVMDYPAPLVKLRKDGTLDTSDAYDVGIGAWDIFGVQYAYTSFKASDEKAELENLVKQALAAGLPFASDQDARSLGSSHSKAHLWDNGSDPVEELNRLLLVRKAAIAKFGKNQIPVGQPMAALEETFVPLYFLHRYQIEAVSKVVGGVDFSYAVRGDGQVPIKATSQTDQLRALRALLATLQPSQLEIPNRLRDLFPPVPFGGRMRAERFSSQSGSVFDPAAAAATAAEMTLSALLHPERAARLCWHEHGGEERINLSRVLSELTSALWRPTVSESEAQLSIRISVQWVAIQKMIALAGNHQATPQVRGVVSEYLRSLPSRLGAASSSTSTPAQRTAAQAMYRYLQRFSNRAWNAPSMPAAPKAPPGSPIGG